jgi:nucleoside-diphosphate-sugar epimerase
VNALVIGAGYLGERVGRLLAGRGVRVFGTTRSVDRAQALRAQGIEPIVADVLVPDSLGDLPAAEWVVYCVGADRRSGSSMRAVHVEGVRNVLDRIAARPTRLVYTSSTGVYGPSQGGLVDEETTPEPVLESGKALLEAEQLLFERQAAFGVSALVVRLAGLYGPGRMVRRLSVERGEPIPGSADHLLNLVHVDDAAAAILAALERGEGGRVYLVCDDRPVSRREYYGLMAELLGMGPPSFVAPEPGSPDALRDQSQKRVSNRRMKLELKVSLAYPDVTTGMRAALAAERAT